MQALVHCVRATEPEQSTAKSGHVINATGRGHVPNAGLALRASPPPRAPVTQVGRFA